MVPVQHHAVQNRMPEWLLEFFLYYCTQENIVSYLSSAFIVPSLVWSPFCSPNGTSAVYSIFCFVISAHTLYIIAPIEYFPCVGAMWVIDLDVERTAACVVSYVMGLDYCRIFTLYLIQKEGMERWFVFVFSITSRGHYDVFLFLHRCANCDPPSSKLKLDGLNSGHEVFSVINNRDKIWSWLGELDPSIILQSYNSIVNE